MAEIFSPLSLSFASSSLIRSFCCLVSASSRAILSLALAYKTLRLRSSINLCFISSSVSFTLTLYHGMWREVWRVTKILFRRYALSRRRRRSVKILALVDKMMQNKDMHGESSKTTPPLRSTALQDLIRSYEARYRFSISFRTSLISDSQEIFSWQNDIRRPAASLMKLFVLGALADEIASGNYDTRQKLTVHTFVGGSGLLKYVGTPIALTFEELAHFMIAYSDNSATNRLIELLTINRVNEFINKIGARNTKMVVPMMPTKACGLKDYNYTTADDILLFYKGLSNNFPKSVHRGCAPLCRKFFAASQPSFLNTMTFFASDVQTRCLKGVAKHNFLSLGKYVYALLSAFRGKRLTKNVAHNRIIAQKSATDKTIFHDSCAVRLGNDFLYVVCMIQCDEGNFYKPLTKRYRAARRLLRRIGKIALNKIHQ